MGDNMVNAQKQQKVYLIIIRFVKYVAQFKQLMIHKKEYKLIYKEKFTKDFFV
jgi:hypothetical protein